MRLDRRTRRRRQALEKSQEMTKLRNGSASQSVERMAAGGHRLRARGFWAAAFAHFFRWTAYVAILS